ncbi:MAG: hypothetical protein AAGF15_06100 [Pseudomonadota bacterium]
MRKRWSVFSVIYLVALSACGNDNGAVEETKTAAVDPGDGLLLVLVEEPAETGCKAKAVFYAKPETNLVRLDTDMIWAGEVGSGNGFGMMDLDNDGILSGETFAVTASADKSCSEVTVQIREIKCETEAGPAASCPALEIQGAERFARVFERPY